MTCPADTRQSGTLLLAAALILISLNLRPALSGIAPLLETIRATTGMSSTGAGVLTTLPVLCFGAIAPFGALLAQRFAVGRILLFCLIMLAASLLLRVGFGLPGLFLGTLGVGASIGVVMVLLPGIIKRDFPRRIGFMTGLYTMALSLGAAIAAGVSVPLLQFGGGWRFSLGFWALPALVAAAAWAYAGRQQGNAGRPDKYRVRGLAGSKLAWQVSLFLGFQSLLAYCVFSWLPAIIADRGIAPVTAGALLSVSIVASLPASLAGPWIAGKGRDQRAAAALLVILMAGGLFGCIYAPQQQLWWWAVVLGIGQGGSFTLATMLIVLRSPSGEIVASLAGMAQLVGYLLAACGPFVTGWLRDASGGWDMPAVFFGCSAIATLSAGLAAGRNLMVRAEVVRAG